MEYVELDTVYLESFFTESFFTCENRIPKNVTWLTPFLFFVLGIVFHYQVIISENTQYLWFWCLEHKDLTNRSSSFRIRPQKVFPVKMTGDLAISTKINSFSQVKNDSRKTSRDLPLFAKPCEKRFQVYCIWYNTIKTKSANGAFEIRGHLLKFINDRNTVK